MSIARGSQISLGALLTNAKEELALEDNTNYDFFLERLLREAMKYTFSMYQTEQRQELIDISDKRAKLPCDFVMFNKNGGWRFTNNGLPYYNWWYNPVPTNFAFFKNNKCSAFPGWETVQLVGDYLYFDMYDDNLPTQIEISALFIKRNADGSIYVPEILERPTVAYACYKFIRSRLNDPQFRFTLAQMSDFKLEWNKGKNWVEAKSKMSDALDKVVLRRVWNSIF